MQKLLQDVSFGANLKRLREKAGLSQAQMVVEIQLRGRSMSRATYAHIEQGVRNVFISDLVLFQEILGADYGAFFDGLKPAVQAE